MPSAIFCKGLTKGNNDADTREKLKPIWMAAFKEYQDATARHSRQHAAAGAFQAGRFTDFP
jgi:hypothetical protein